jgi:hypothetical protein
MWTITLTVMGILFVLLLLVGILRVTMREEPMGCVIVFGGLFFMIVVLLIIGPWLVKII